LSAVISLAQSRNEEVAAAAFKTVEAICSGSFLNQNRLRDLETERRKRVSPGAKDEFESPFQKYCNDIFDNLIRNVEELQRWSSTPEEGVASDDLGTVAMRVTKQFGLTCFIFAAVRSFNRRSHFVCGCCWCCCVLLRSRHTCLSMREAGVYKDLEGNGGRWELKQALRWAAIGQIFTDGEWVQCPDFSGFGFEGGQSSIVLAALLKHYAPMHWPEHGKKIIDLHACFWTHF
jgi:hypothetical protein